MQQLHIMSIAFPVNVTEAMLGKHRPLVEYSRNTGMISEGTLQNFKLVQHAYKEDGYIGWNKVMIFENEIAGVWNTRNQCTQCVWQNQFTNLLYKNCPYKFPWSVWKRASNKEACMIWYILHAYFSIFSCNFKFSSTAGTSSLAVIQEHIMSISVLSQIKICGLVTSLVAMNPISLQVCIFSMKR